MAPHHPSSSRSNWLWLVLLLATLVGVAVYVSQARIGADGGRMEVNANADADLQGFGSGSLTGEYLVGYYAQRSKDLDIAADAFAKAAEQADETQSSLHFTAMHSAVLAGRVQEAVEMARDNASIKPESKPDTAAVKEPEAPKEEAAVSPEDEDESDAPDVAAPSAASNQQDVIMARYVSVLGNVHDKAWDKAAQELALSAVNFSPFQKLMFDITDAWVLQAQGKPNEALARIDTLTGLDKRSMLIAYQKALILIQAKRYDEADKLFEQMLANQQLVMPRRVVEVYAASLHARGQGEKAGQIVDKYQDKSSMLWQEIANLQDVALVKNPGYLTDPAYGIADLLYGIASLARQQGSSEAAIQFLQLALYLEPDYDAARVFLAAIWTEQKMYPWAINEYEKVSKSSPYWLHAQLNMASAKASLDDYNGATALLKSLTKKYPDHASVWLQLGDTLRRHEEFKEAADAYSQALELMKDVSDDERWPVLYMRGICYERSKQWPKAEADLKKTLELSPDQPDVLNYLGYSWLDMGMHTDEAKAMIEKAVDQRPLDAHILDSMGWAYFRLGQYPEALDYILQAIELMPTDAIVTHHYADVLWKLDRKREAYFEWQRALLFNPTPEDKALIEDKIEHGYKPSKRTD
ncbi:tetratricopeptide repeat protein [bacterium]|nr:tetratricopeptide repeat protein [bacterium]